jgi:uncharacterized C2H2 Zn-finger protein
MKGFIYIINISNTDFYKIGMTQNPDKRLQTLQTSHPHKLIETALFRAERYKAIEKQLHVEYNDNRGLGEWFQFTYDELHNVIKYAKELCEKNKGGLVSMDDETDKRLKQTDAKKNNEIKTIRYRDKNRKIMYECDKCGKIFNHKGTYDKHINRKNSCDKQITKGDDKNTCKKCGVIFQHRGSLYNHVKNDACKADKVIKIEIQNVETQNIENNTNVQIDGDFNVDVKVVMFGDENLSYISDDTFKKIIGREFKFFEEFMNHVHFNKDHPENHNIYEASMKDGHVITYNGERWDVELADQILDDLIQQKSDIFEDKYDKIADKLSQIESKKFNNFNNFINHKDDEKTKLLSNNSADKQKLDVVIEAIKNENVDNNTLDDILRLLNKE